MAQQQNKAVADYADKRTSSQDQQEQLVNRYLSESASLKADIRRLQTQVSGISNGYRTNPTVLPVIIPRTNEEPEQISKQIQRDTLYIRDTVVITETIRSTDTLTLIKRDTLIKTSGPVPAIVVVQRDTIVAQKTVDYTAIPADIILFDIGSASIRPIYTRRLDYVANVLLKNNGLQVTITGHTDRSGSPKINEALSNKRAEMVAAYLINKGVQPSRLVTDAVSWLEPAVAGNSTSANSQNRRVVIKLLKR